MADKQTFKTPAWLQEVYDKTTHIAYYSSGYYGLPDGKGSFYLWPQDKFEDDKPHENMLHSEVPTDVLKTVLAEMKKAQELAEPELAANPEVRFLLKQGNTNFTLGYGQFFPNVLKSSIDPVRDPKVKHLAGFGDVGMLVAGVPEDNKQFLIGRDGKYHELHGTGYMRRVIREEAQHVMDRVEIEGRTNPGEALSSKYITFPEVDEKGVPTKDSPLIAADMKYQESALFKAFKAEATKAPGGARAVLGLKPGDIPTAEQSEILAKASIMTAKLDEVYAEYAKDITDPLVQSTRSEFADLTFARARRITFDCQQQCTLVMNAKTGKYEVRPDLSDHYENVYTSLKASLQGLEHMARMHNAVNVITAGSESKQPGIPVGSAEMRFRQFPDVAGVSINAVEYMSLFAPNLARAYAGEHAVSPLVKSHLDPKAVSAEARPEGWVGEMRDKLIKEGILPASVKEADAAALAARKEKQQAATRDGKDDGLGGQFVPKAVQPDQEPALRQ